MQDIKEWVELRDREKAITNMRIYFEVWATCSTFSPSLQWRISPTIWSHKITNSYKFLQELSDPQVPHSVPKDLQFELASSLKDATSTTSQIQERRSLLDHKNSQTIPITKFEEVERWDYKCEKSLKRLDWQLKSWNKEFRIWRKSEIYWNSFENYLEILIYIFGKVLWVSLQCPDL